MLRDKNYIYIILISALLFIPFLGVVHLFDWDEINFAEAAREMIVTGNYAQVQINFLPFWEKPPLFIWMQVLSMKVFGINEFAARFPNAIIGIITLCVIYTIGKKLVSKNFGLIWVMIYLGSFLPHFYFKSALIDPTFNLFIFLSMYFLSSYYTKIQDKQILVEKGNKTEEDEIKNSFQPSRFLVVLSGCIAGMAVLTKGPVAILIIVITLVIFLYSIKLKFVSLLFDCLVWISYASIISSIWLSLELYENGFGFIYKFLLYQIRLLSTPDSGHGGFLLYHWVVLLIGVFPASIFFAYYLISGIYKKLINKPLQLVLFSRMMMISFFVVLVLFTLVRTKIVHYSSFCYLPLTFFAARYIYYLYESQLKLNRFIQIFVTIVAGLITISLIGLIYIGNNPSIIIPHIHDAFAVGNLETNVKWPWYLYLIPFVYFGIMAYSLFNKEKLYNKSTLLFGSSAVFLSLMMLLIVPRIEKYSQAAAIEFYESKKYEDCYIEVLGFKSYAHLFYADKKPSAAFLDSDWLLNDKLDKPAYFVCKIGNEQNYMSYSDMQLLYKKNGFVFFKRDVIK